LREQDDRVLSKAVPALSALLKDHDVPLAKFVGSGGLAAIAGLLSSDGGRECISASTQMKAVFLLAHIFKRHPASRNVVREQGMIGKLLPLLTHSDVDLREKTLLALQDLLTGDRDNAQACIALYLHSVGVSPAFSLGTVLTLVLLARRSFKNE